MSVIYSVEALVAGEQVTWCASGVGMYPVADAFASLVIQGYTAVILEHGSDNTYRVVCEHGDTSALELPNAIEDPRRKFFPGPVVDALRRFQVGDDTECPKCGLTYSIRDRCRNGWSYCANGHQWRWVWKPYANIWKVELED